MVQSCLNSDGTRTLVKYDENKMLSEFARYIAKKEQPISLTYYTDFVRLVIRGGGQSLYKRFHHNKMVFELKNNMLNKKVNYWPYLQLQQIKYQLHLKYGLSVNMVLVIVVLSFIILIMIGLYKKKIKFSNHGLSTHCTNYLSSHYKCIA
jgi:hypothetical protein